MIPALLRRLKLTSPARLRGAGIALGVLYGLCMRLLFGTRGDLPDYAGAAFAVMSLTFLLVVPAVIGAITVSLAEAPSWRYRAFAPWIPVVLMVLAAVAIGWEGRICALMALPILLLGASIGGLLGGRVRGRGARSLLLAAPLLAGPMELRVVPTPNDVTRTVTETVIQAPPATVWPLVASVDSIRPEERHASLFTSLGFPHPISATLSRPGTGGIRRARFERGLVFTETVTDWQPERRLRFSIVANTADLPPTTLDQHVKIGGPYFDVLTGTYELQPVDGGRATRLVLWSEHRLSTRFNPYAGWWVERVMSSIQSNILSVHKARAERHMRGDLKP